MSNYIARFNKQGNIKLGNMWTFNKLAGGGEINGCNGSCGEFCHGCYNPDDPKKSDCYVFKSYVLYGWDKSSVVKGHIRNTEIMRTNMKQAFLDICRQLKRARSAPDVVRIHASGELESAEELLQWIDVARKFPNTKFYIYTKAYRYIDEAFYQMPKIPMNFFINISIWHESGIACYERWNYLKSVRAFVYDDGYDYGDRLKTDCHCPAYDDHGKLHHDLTCDKCRICFQQKAKVCACHSH